MIGRNPHAEPPQELLDNRSDPGARAVLDDWRLSNGETPTRLGVALWMIHSDAGGVAVDADTDVDDVADDDDDVDADDGADDDDDDDDAGADDDDDDDDADVDADTDDDDVADDDDDVDADDGADDDDVVVDAGADDDAESRASRLSEILIGEIEVEDGLKIIALPGRYGYSAVFACHLRRVTGDEYEMLPGYRFVYRTGERKGLSWLASNGPGDHYMLKEPSEVAEPVHRLVIRRCLKANAEAWAKHVKAPKADK